VRNLFVGVCPREARDVEHPLGAGDGDVDQARFLQREPVLCPIVVH
jgi:hypothetical protein